MNDSDIRRIGEITLPLTVGPYFATAASDTRTRAPSRPLS